MPVEILDGHGLFVKLVDERSGLPEAPRSSEEVATQRADVTLFFLALKKKLKATSSGLLLRAPVRSTRLLAFVHLGCGCAGLGSGL